MASVPDLVVGVAASVLYVTAGQSLILLNNQLLHEFGFPYPIALSAFGVSFAAFTCRTLVLLGFTRLTQRPTASFWWTSVLPLAMLSAATLGLGNSAYIHLSVAICQILKSLTPVMALGLLYAMRVEPPSVAVSMCVALICVGTVVATSGAISLSRLGVLLQLSANLAEALRVVLSQRLLSGPQQLPLLEMQYHVAPWQATCLLSASLLLELNQAEARAAAAAAVMASPLRFLIASSLGFLLQLAALLVIRLVGSVTMKLLGTARNASLVLLQVLRGADSVSSTQLLGHGLSSCAFVAYTLVRVYSAQTQRAQAKKQQ